MKNINNRFHAIIVGATIAILAVAMPSEARAQLVSLETIVAIVDEDVVLASEVVERIEQVRSAISSQGLQIPPDDVLFEETLNRLILESIQLQLADRFGVRIPDAQLDESVARLAAQNGLSISQFREAIEASGQSYNKTRESMRRELAIQRVQQGSVMRNIRVTEKEIDNFLLTDEGISLTQPEYRIVQALLPTSRDDLPQDKEVKAAYAESVLASILGGTSFSEAMSTATEYQFQGGDLGWRKINDIPSMFQQIVKTLDRGETGMVTSASGYHLVYLADTRGLTQLIEQSATRHILIVPSEILDEESAKNLAQELSNRIRAGEDFADLAREYSEDIGSAQEGGDLGWVSPGQMVPEFESAMADAVVGEVTDPIRSEFGWHILEVTERRIEDFANQIKRNQIANYLREVKYEEELENWLGKIREEAFVDIK